MKYPTKFSRQDRLAFSVLSGSERAFVGRLLNLFRKIDRRGWSVHSAAKSFSVLYSMNPKRFSRLYYQYRAIGWRALVNKANLTAGQKVVFYAE